MYETSVHPEARDEAIRHIGTNALPYLLKWFRYETPEWKTNYYRAVNSLVRGSNPDWTFTYQRDLGATYAFLAFYALGPQAKPAIPKLTRMLNDQNDPANAHAAAAVLGLLGDDGLRPLVAVLTNQQREPILRSNVAWQISILATNKALAIPALVSILEDPDSDVRAAATNALLKIDPQALEKNTP